MFWISDNSLPIRFDCNWMIHRLYFQLITFSFQVLIRFLKYYNENFLFSDRS